MTERAVLVTGGAGYVGSHVCKVLAHAGFLPVTFDNMSHGHEWAVRWGPLERGDLLDSDRICEALRVHQPVAVAHIAGFAYPAESVIDPLKYYRNNVTGTANLLDAMYTAHVDRLIFSSTCATYGVPDSGPIKEEHPQRPVNPYGHSKLMIEQILRDCGHAYGVRSVALRYFNAAGADPTGEIGEAHDREQRLIPSVLRTASDPTSPVTVFGRDYPTPDGTCIRDYIHVEDIATAHLLALRYLDRSAGLAAINLGTGRGHSVREVIEASKRVTGRDVPVQFGPRRPGDPPELVADATRARELLGWRPQWNEIDAIIETAWRWYERRGSLNAA